MSNQKSVYVVDGGKGSAGKSTVTTAIIDTAIHFGMSALVVESDDSNPDIYKSHHAVASCEI